MPRQILGYHEIRPGVVFGKDDQRFGTLIVWDVSENCECLDIESI